MTGSTPPGRNNADKSPLWLSQISPSRRALVRLCQNINFGTIQDLRFKDAEPLLEPTAVILFDVKLDREDEPRREIGLADFELAAEFRRLFRRLKELETGVIARIEVHAGIPRHIVCALPSPTSVKGCPSLYGRFNGTTAQSDFS